VATQSKQGLLAIKHSYNKVLFSSLG